MDFSLKSNLLKGKLLSRRKKVTINDQSQYFECGPETIYIRIPGSEARNLSL